MHTTIKPKKIMIFGRPGSGKSTFAYGLAHQTGLPLHHLDKHFFIAGWVERNYQEFMTIQEDIIKRNAWIIDGNNTRSLEMRWQKADLVLYFNCNKFVCLFRVFKRCFKKTDPIDDRAENCPETMNLKFIKYMWTFENRVKDAIETCSRQYPAAHFVEIKRLKDLEKLQINPACLNEHTDHL